MSHYAPRVRDLRAQLDLVNTKLAGMVTDMADVADTNIYQELYTDLQHQRARLEFGLKKLDGREQGSVKELPAGSTEDVITENRRYSAVELVNTTTHAKTECYLPLAPGLPSSLLASGFFPALDRTALLRAYPELQVKQPAGRLCAFADTSRPPPEPRVNLRFPLASGCDMLYTGPRLSRDDRDVLLAAFRLVNEQPLSRLGDEPDEAHSFSGVKVSLKQFVEACGRKYSSSTRDTIIASLYRLQDLRLEVGAKKENADGSVSVATFPIPRLVEFAKVVETGNGNGRGYLWLRVSDNATKLFGYRDFVKLETHSDKHPPFVSFVLDYFSVHANGTWAVKDTHLRQLSGLGGSFKRFRRSLTEALAYLIKRDYVVLHRAVTNAEPKDDEPKTCYQYRLYKPGSSPAAPRDGWCVMQPKDKAGK